MKFWLPLVCPIATATIIVLDRSGSNGQRFWFFYGIMGESFAASMSRSCANTKARLSGRVQLWLQSDSEIGTMRASSARRRGLHFFF